MEWPVVDVGGRHRFLLECPGAMQGLVQGVGGIVGYKTQAEEKYEDLEV